MALFLIIEEWDVEKITEYMQRNKYSKENIDIVARSVERLKLLVNANRKKSEQAK